MGNCSSAQAPPAKRTKSASSPRQTLKGDDRPTRKELPALEKRKATMGLPVKAEPSPVHSQPAQTDAGSVAGTSVSPAGVVKAKADMPALSLDDHESDSPKTPQHFQNGGANGLPSYGGNFMKTSIRNGGRTPLAAAAAKGILKNVSRNGSLGGSTSGSSRSDEKGAGKWSCGKSSLESKNSSGIFTPSMCVQSPVVSLKEISGAGDELDAVFQLIDAEKYSKALPKLHALLSHRAADSADYFAIHLALSTLHGLGNDSWTAPDYRLNPSEAELAKTAEYLLGLNAKDGGSPSALLALSEMYAILKDTAHESLYMAKAAESQHPLAVLRAEIFTLVKLRKQRDAGLLAVHSYDLEKEKHVQKLIQLSEGNTRVAAHAGMLTWVSFYKGTDGVETDIYKAKELLERAIRAEMGPENGKSLKRQLQRIHKKIMTQEHQGLAHPGACACAEHKFVETVSHRAERTGL
ncbi:hypothetical protein DIPPA_35784 [Diplonema papillatum]|nr:hypothetical protein DIPPA_35784 [Diplonema papillatum]